MSKSSALLALAGLLAGGAAFSESTPVKQEGNQPKASQAACGEGKCAAACAAKTELPVCAEGQSAEKGDCQAASASTPIPEKGHEGSCGGAAKSDEGGCGSNIR